MSDQPRKYQKVKGEYFGTVFAQTLHAIRCNELGVSQAEFAGMVRALGGNGFKCHTSTVSKWEAGLSYPAPRYRQILVRLLKIPATRLFGDVDRLREEQAR